MQEAYFLNGRCLLEEGKEVTDHMTNASERSATNSDLLFEENRELKACLRYLTSRQTTLEQRLERVENSAVFRLLRWLGPKLASLGLPVPGSAPMLHALNSTASANQQYTSWIEETASRPPASEEIAPAALRHEPSRKPISIVLRVPNPDRSRLERTLASLQSQHHRDWELFVLLDAEPPDWLRQMVEDIRCGRTAKIVAGDAGRQGFKFALQQCRGVYTAIVNGDAILEPTALDAMAASAAPETVAVYSDWDFISSKGRRHTPRFTPECSPELLSQTMYWGSCYLTRTAAVRELIWPDEPQNTPLEHELAIHLVKRSNEVRRIPKVLWHIQDGAEDPVARPMLSARPRHTSMLTGSKSIVTLDASPIRLDFRASIIICSRNAKLLTKCLRNLRPTLGPHDEVIVVAHQAGDSIALEKAASDHGARVVPYQGAFHFGLMNRLGVEASGAPVICMMNDDVCPLTEDWLPTMLEQAKRPDVGVVGALLLYPNGTIEHAGIAVGGRHFPAHVGRFQNGSPYWPWLRVTREVTAVTGACMVMRRVVWDELDGFDCRFPVNFNDVDLCLRAAERGYKVLLEARAVLTHEGCRTRTPTVQSEEHELLYKLWWPVMTAPDKFFNPQFGSAIEPILLGPLAGH
jgi:GT2 family glycosyltransferase